MTDFSKMTHEEIMTYLKNPTPAEASVEFKELADNASKANADIKKIDFSKIGGNIKIDYTQLNYEEITKNAKKDLQAATANGVTELTNAGSTQTDNVNAAAEAQIENIGATGSTQVGIVNATGAAQIKALEEKKADLESELVTKNGELTKELEDIATKAKEDFSKFLTEGEGKSIIEKAAQAAMSTNTETGAKEFDYDVALTKLVENKRDTEGNEIPNSSPIDTVLTNHSITVKGGKQLKLFDMKEGFLAHLRKQMTEKVQEMSDGKISMDGAYENFVKEIQNSFEAKANEILSAESIAKMVDGKTLLALQEIASLREEVAQIKADLDTALKAIASNSDSHEQIANAASKKCASDDMKVNTLDSKCYPQNCFDEDGILSIEATGCNFDPINTDFVQ